MRRAAGVSVYTPPSIARNSKCPASEKSISELKKKNTTVQSRMRIANNSTFCSNRRAVPTELTKTKMLDAAGFPVTSNCKSSILFEDQLDNHILQVLRIVDLFVVLFLVYDE